MKKISIIVITKNDPSAVITLQKLISHKSNVSFEILLITKTQSISESLISIPGVEVIGYFNSDKAITIPEQRNIGVKKSKGDAVVFIDSSCIPYDSWLDNLFAHYLAGESIVSGYVSTSDKRTVNSISGQSNKNDYIEECPTANVLISKKVFKKIGFFDESFEYGSDTDIMWRARDAGFKIRYEPNAIVSHDFGGVNEQILRSYRYGKARTQLFFKHPKRLKNVVFVDPVFFFYPIFILFSPVIILFPYYVMLLFIPIIKNWKNSPFKIVALNLIFGIGVLVKILKTLIPQPSKNRSN